jgi:eukaryotic-like serine/threonine-protein kinase
VKRGDHLGGGRYSLLDELGRGGMGVVWLGEDSTIGRRVAIKELRLPDGIAPHERQVFEERVLREARTAGRLNDPGIVTVYDVVQERGGMFIVMELVEYPDLADVVRQHGALSTSFVAKIAEQLLSALEAAHAAGVVHRDVKPANVMVAPNGRVKLTDFGIAQATDDPRLTQSGTLIGSPTYISPERLLGRDASPASDLWALGATLFFAVEGYGAYERPTTPASIQAIMNERAQVRLAHGPLADVIMGLLEPAPERRLDATRTRQMIEQARALAGSTGEQLTIKNTVQQLAPPTGKSKRGIAIAAAAAVVVILAVVLVFTTNLFGAKDQGTPAAPPESSTSAEPSAESTPETTEPTETSETSAAPETPETSETSGASEPQIPTDFESAVSEAFDPSAG